jgi:hypothetical protein
MVLNVVVALSGLFLIIPGDIALLATGSTTTLQGTITFGITFVCVHKLFQKQKGNEVITDYIATFVLMIGNTTFIFLQNYSFALEIIIVCIFVLSYNYIKHPDYPLKYKINYFNNKGIGTQMRT